MEIEQLQMILDAAAAAGDGAMSVVMMWFGIKLLGMVLTGGIVSGIAYGIYSLVLKGVTNSTFVGRIAAATKSPMWRASNRDNFIQWVIETYKTPE